MTQVTLEAARVGRGERVLDVAAGLGDDGHRLAERGVWAVCAEPSRRMSDLGRELFADREPGPVRLRAWAEALPFRDGAFDATLCKGSLDHFDDPLGCLAELARVTHSEGRVVLAIANFDSLACRLSRASARLRPPTGLGRQGFHVPSDHFTRYDPAILREHVRAHLSIVEWTGVSLLWGAPAWSPALRRLGSARARPWLRLADATARLLPDLADVLIVAGHPRKP